MRLTGVPHHPGSRPRATGAVELSTRQTAILVLLLIVPVPLLTLSGVAVPFPDLVQRALAPLLPFVEAPGNASAAEAPPAVGLVPILGLGPGDAPVARAPTSVVVPRISVPQPSVSAATSDAPETIPAGPGDAGEPVDDAEPAADPPSLPTDGGAGSPPADGGGSSGGSTPQPPQPPSSPPSSPSPPPPPAPAPPPPPPPPAPPPAPPPPPPPPAPPPPPPPPPTPPPPPPPPIAGVVPPVGGLLDDPIGTLEETVETILGPILGKPKR